MRKLLSGNKHTQSSIIPSTTTRLPTYTISQNTLGELTITATQKEFSVLPATAENLKDCLLKAWNHSKNDTKIGRHCIYLCGISMQEPTDNIVNHFTPEYCEIDSLRFITGKGQALDCPEFVPKKHVWNVAIAISKKEDITLSHAAISNDKNKSLVLDAETIIDIINDKDCMEFPTLQEIITVLQVENKHLAGILLGYRQKKLESEFDGHCIALKLFR
jgi:hypothetical protein